MLGLSWATPWLLLGSSLALVIDDLLSSTAATANVISAINNTNIAMTVTAIATAFDFSAEEQNPN